MQCVVQSASRGRRLRSPGSSRQKTCIDPGVWSLDDVATNSPADLNRLVSKGKRAKQHEWKRSCFFSRGDHARHSQRTDSWVNRTGCFLNRRNDWLPNVAESLPLLAERLVCKGKGEMDKRDGVLSRTPKKKNSLEKRCTIFSLSHWVTYFFPKQTWGLFMCTVRRCCSSKYAPTAGRLPEDRVCITGKGAVDF
jgi:hypothetical protein